MSPPFRRSPLETRIPPDARDAAVLVLLTPVNGGYNREELLEWKVLLIRRTVDSSVHSGQIAFPGGKYEPDDENLWQTACREAFEEMGVTEAAIQQTGALTELYVEVSRFRLCPFVAVCTAPIIFRPGEGEVDGYKQVPLKIFNPDLAQRLNLDGPPAGRYAPAWFYEEYIVWGATAMVLSELYRCVDSGVLTRGR